MADLVNSDKHPKYGRRPGAESDFPFEAALEGEVSTASSGRSLLGKTRQRIAAKRRRPAAEDDAPDVRKRRTTEPNIMQKLASRECSGTTQLRKFSHSKCFLDMKLNAEFDTHDEKECREKLPFLRKRSKIVEVVAAQDLIFALTRTGVCAVFSRATHSRLCFVNLCPDEVIRSLFYNKLNESLVTVSVFRDDNFSSLKCRSTQLAYIRRKTPDGGYPLFESESLCWPGFVEFDDVNGKVLTYSAKDKAYKIWDLRSYRLLYTIKDDNIHEIKISPGIMLVIYRQQSPPTIPLHIRSIETGEILKKFTHLLKQQKIDFIEQFNEKLLIKQEQEDLQIFDIRNAEQIRIPQEHFKTPSAFIFLYENQLFLTFRQNTVTVWNLRGEKVTTFEDHELWHPDCNTNNIYITSKQDLIVSYCRSKQTAAPKSGSSSGSASPSPVGTVNISSIFSGRCLAKISPQEAGADERHAKALQRISAVFYNEVHNEIYTGNEQGLLHIWSTVPPTPTALAGASERAR